MSLLVIALLVVLLFGGLGLAAHVLWWGLLIGVVLIVADLVRRRGP